MKIEISFGCVVVAMFACSQNEANDRDASVRDARVIDSANMDSAECDKASNESRYSFPSRFVDGESSVSYSGQTFRHTLIHRLDHFISNLGQSVDRGAITTHAEALASLNYFFRFDGDANGDDEIGIEWEILPLQRTWNDLASGKDLLGKLAGNDSTTDHQMWNAGQFIGWEDTSINGNAAIESPTVFVEALFAKLGENAFARAEGEQPLGPNGESLPVYVTADGLDLRQLIQKFLLMAVAFSQGTDDYLDDDVEEKGLLLSNARDGEAAYSKLEHAWDEAFGYFGAARDYDLYSDDEIASKGGREAWQGRHDTNGDCRIDLRSETNWGASVNAAKRDRGATQAIDLSAQAFEAFVAGRNLLHQAKDTLTAEEQTQLANYRDTIVAAWEAAIAATVIHYINEVLGDMQNIGTEDYSFEDHAKHWSELKGFALGLQFNPRSPTHESEGERTVFATLHQKIGDRPVWASDELSTYREALSDARALLGQAYEFHQSNVEEW